MREHERTENRFPLVVKRVRFPRNQTEVKNQKKEDRVYQGNGRDSAGDQGNVDAMMRMVVVVWCAVVHMHDEGAGVVGNGGRMTLVLASKASHSKFGVERLADDTTQLTAVSGKNHRWGSLCPRKSPSQYPCC